jgi:hypothetical protein
MAAQLFTLLGVLLGAGLSYLAGWARERAKYRRDLSQRWEERKLDAYVAYISDVKQMRAIARRIAGDSIPDPGLPIALSREVGLPLLGEAEARRSVSAEVVALVGGADVISALRTLNQAVWRLEWFARGKLEDDGTAWQAAEAAYSGAINTFQECARRDLNVPGLYLRRAN